mmetsp:Transcript_20737/g.43397  ORF Transcript_20737/g.43397 Transcript_20737/m.43397 type:complete len:231 (-) Transcript_20737:2273-2965(-)
MPPRWYSLDPRARGLFHPGTVAKPLAVFVFACFFVLFCFGLLDGYAAGGFFFSSSVLLARSLQAKPRPIVSFFLSFSLSMRGPTTTTGLVRQDRSLRENRTRTGQRVSRQGLRIPEFFHQAGRTQSRVGRNLQLQHPHPRQYGPYPQGHGQRCWLQRRQGRQVQDQARARGHHRIPQAHRQVRRSQPLEGKRGDNRRHFFFGVKQPRRRIACGPDRNGPTTTNGTARHGR